MKRPFKCIIKWKKKLKNIKKSNFTVCWIAFEWIDQRSWWFTWSELHCCGFYRGSWVSWVCLGLLRQLGFSGFLTVWHCHGLWFWHLWFQLLTECIRIAPIRQILLLSWVLWSVIARSNFTDLTVLCEWIIHAQVLFSLLGIQFIFIFYNINVGFFTIW